MGNPLLATWDPNFLSSQTPTSARALTCDQHRRAISVLCHMIVKECLYHRSTEYNDFFKLHKLWFFYLFRTPLTYPDKTHTYKRQISSIFIGQNQETAHSHVWVNITYTFFWTINMTSPICLWNQFSTERKTVPVQAAVMLQCAHVHKSTVTI
jgi:hypothetical protein